ncbi:hypothetical protein Tcan_05271 [Toxocara canis]|uniref:Uncharacterized protein n=1 Tax=Toxocara canis TaxID=6265 RepID=A0A0B2VI02_TOXCA|nr:hypothetical protein Tcan_05282 [Toxocara canis]KHN81092.1 hypothetical protein Tcan_05271 [Toxocara canis]
MHWNTEGVENVVTQVMKALDSPSVLDLPEDLNTEFFGKAKAPATSGRVRVVLQCGRGGDASCAADVSWQPSVHRTGGQIAVLAHLRELRCLGGSGKHLRTRVFLERTQTQRNDDRRTAKGVLTDTATIREIVGFSKIFPFQDATAIIVNATKSPPFNETAIRPTAPVVAANFQSFNTRRRSLRMSLSFRCSSLS